MSALNFRRRSKWYNVLNPLRKITKPLTRKDYTMAIFYLEIIIESDKCWLFVDKLFWHIKTLETLGYYTMTRGQMLLHIISIKLDSITLLK